MKYITIILLPLLVSCGKFSDVIDTGMNGYAIRCIDNTTYILMSSDRGLAITPHLNKEGLPVQCNN